MNNPTTRPAGPAGDPDLWPAANELRDMHVTAGVRLWHRVGIAAAAITYHPAYGPGRGPLDGHLSVEVRQATAGGLDIVVDDPETAEDLAAALVWAATRLREQLAAGEPAIDRRAFGLVDLDRLPRTKPDATTPDATVTTETKEAA